jgi:hypothetical protein
VSSHAYEVPGISRAKIAAYADALRKGLGYGAEPWLPIDRVLEFDLPRFHEDFSLIVEEIDVLGNRHGVTLPRERTIILRRDVYERACEGHGRDRFTVAHELGHYLMHDAPGLERQSPVSRGSIPAFRDSEWQANSFAADLLMPATMIQQFSTITEVCSEFGVSRDAARVQVRIWTGKGALSSVIRDE